MISAKKQTDERGNEEIEFVAVHPDYWNKGIGTLLVRRGVEMADELGLDMYVLSFEGGYRTYKAFDFETLEHMELDDSIYGGAGVFHRYFMERKYKGKSQVGREIGQDTK
jgi:N-acetylglutamate synthase-like GNAT family acetyltransferase